MKKSLLGIFFITSALFLASCDNLEKDIVGEWQMNDDCDPDFDEGIVSFTDKSTVSGIEGYSSYEVIANDNNKSGKVILKSEDDSRTLKIKLDGDKLNISEDGSALACTVKRAD